MKRKTKRKMKIKYKRKTKTWWKKHWDEILLVLTILLGIFFMFKGLGAI